MPKDVSDEALRELASSVVKAETTSNEEPSAYIVQRLMAEGEYAQAGRWINKQTYLGGYDPALLHRLRKRLPGLYLNIGGGPQFAYPFWENLDSAKSPLNPNPFFFGPQIDFPFPDEKFELIYSSHAIEHLDNPTVEKVLAESRRCLKSGGSLLIKIPDFDETLKAWREDRTSYFENEWNFQAVVPTLANRGVADSVTVRAAMVFCAFWNTAFGDMFGAYNAAAPGAYHGPPPMDEAELFQILSNNSPNKIAKVLRDRVEKSENDFVFNHQNGWSQTEMISLLGAHGFSFVSSDRDKIVQRFNFVPKVSQMFGISSYYLAAV